MITALLAHYLGAAHLLKGRAYIELPTGPLESDIHSAYGTQKSVDNMLSRVTLEPLRSQVNIPVPPEHAPKTRSIAIEI